MIIISSSCISVKCEFHFSLPHNHPCIGEKTIAAVQFFSVKQRHILLKLYMLTILKLLRASIYLFFVITQMSVQVNKNQNIPRGILVTLQMLPFKNRNVGKAIIRKQKSVQSTAIYNCNKVTKSIQESKVKKKTHINKRIVKPSYLPAG